MASPRHDQRRSISHTSSLGSFTRSMWPRTNERPRATARQTCTDWRFVLAPLLLGAATSWAYFLLAEYLASDSVATDVSVMTRPGADCPAVGALEMGARFPVPARIRAHGPRTSAANPELPVLLGSSGARSPPLRLCAGESEYVELRPAWHARLPFLADTGDGAITVAESDEDGELGYFCRGPDPNSDQLTVWQVALHAMEVQRTAQWAPMQPARTVARVVGTLVPGSGDSGGVLLLALSAVAPVEAEPANASEPWVEAISVPSMRVAGARPLSAAGLDNSVVAVANDGATVFALTYTAQLMRVEPDTLESSAPLPLHPAESRYRGRLVFATSQGVLLCVLATVPDFPRPDLVVRVDASGSVLAVDTTTTLETARSNVASGFISGPSLFLGTATDPARILRLRIDRAYIYTEGALLVPRPARRVVGSGVEGGLGSLTGAPGGLSAAAAANINATDVSGVFAFDTAPSQVVVLGKDGVVVLHRVNLAGDPFSMPSAPLLASEGLARSALISGDFAYVGGAAGSISRVALNGSVRGWSNMGRLAAVSRASVAGASEFPPTAQHTSYAMRQGASVGGETATAFSPVSPQVQAGGSTELLSARINLAEWAVTRTHTRAYSALVTASAIIGMLALMVAAVHVTASVYRAYTGAGDSVSSPRVLRQRSHRNAGAERARDASRELQREREEEKDEENEDKEDKEDKEDEDEEEGHLRSVDLAGQGAGGSEATAVDRGQKEEGADPARAARGGPSSPLRALRRVSYLAVAFSPRFGRKDRSQRTSYEASDEGELEEETVAASPISPTSRSPRTSTPRVKRLRSIHGEPARPPGLGHVGIAITGGTPVDTSAEREAPVVSGAATPQGDTSGGEAHGIQESRFWTASRTPSSLKREAFHSSSATPAPTPAASSSSSRVAPQSRPLGAAVDTVDAVERSRSSAGLHASSGATVSMARQDRTASAPQLAAAATAGSGGQTALSGKAGAVEQSSVGDSETRKASHARLSPSSPTPADSDSSSSRVAPQSRPLGAAVDTVDAVERSRSSAGLHASTGATVSMARQDRTASAPQLAAAATAGSGGQTALSGKAGAVEQSSVGDSETRKASHARLSPSSPTPADSDSSSSRVAPQSRPLGAAVDAVDAVDAVERSRSSAGLHASTGATVSMARQDRTASAPQLAAAATAGSGGQKALSGKAGAVEQPSVEASRDGSSSNGRAPSDSAPPPASIPSAPLSAGESDEAQLSRSASVRQLHAQTETQPRAASAVDIGRQRGDGTGVPSLVEVHASEDDPLAYECKQMDR